MSLDLKMKRTKRKKSRITQAEENELQRLEEFLFGKGKSVLKSVGDTLTSSSGNSSLKQDHKPAWEDPDDGDLNVIEALSSQGRPKMGVPAKPTDDYQKVLQKRFETRVGNPKWAKLNVKTDDNSEEELLTHCGNFIDKRKEALCQGKIDIKRLKPLNKATKREGPYINSVQFHPTSSVALVAGSAGVASIFQVDGCSNPHLQSVRFENFPVRCARFSQDGNKFIVGSQHKTHFYVYDMLEGRSIKVPTHHTTEQTNMKKFEISPDGKLIAVCGKFGHIHLLHAHTREWAGALKMNGEVTALCFSPDGSKLWSYGDAGEVYVWDIGGRKCMHRFADEGCLQGTSLSVSPSHQLVACGSSSGVVNVYKTQQAMKSAAPQPVKAIMNLVTAVTSLEFNCTSQILAMSSDGKDGALKLVHLPSVTVFSNFPGPESVLGRPVCLSFSPNSGYLAVGSSLHTVPLFRLKHFGNY